MTKLYTVYVSDVSYFSGKLEALLRYKQLDYRRVEISARILRDEVLPHTGLMKVPVVKTAEGQWLKDTTPMIDWFDQQHPESAVTPEDPATRFISKLIEDYADEWLWRPALYYRWRYKNDFWLLGGRIADTALREWKLPKALLAWYFGKRQDAIHLRGDGVRKHNEAHVEQTYLRQLDCLQEILSQQDFLLGDRPCTVDYGYFGPFFRHFGLDPTAQAIMIHRAPDVYAWLGRMWAAKHRNLNAIATLQSFDNPAWDYVFQQLNEVYLPYLHKNAMAFSAGKKRITVSAEGYSYVDIPVVQYRVACRQQLQVEWFKLNPAEQSSVINRLGSREGIDWLEKDGNIASGIEDEFQLPLKPYQPKSRWQRLLLGLSGTPRDMPNQ